MFWGDACANKEDGADAASADCKDPEQVYKAFLEAPRHQAWACEHHEGCGVTFFSGGSHHCRICGKSLCEEHTVSDKELSTYLLTEVQDKLGNLQAPILALRLDALPEKLLIRHACLECALQARLTPDDGDLYVDPLSLELAVLNQDLADVKGQIASLEDQLAEDPAPHNAPSVGELVTSEYHWSEDVELTEKIRQLRAKKLEMLQTSRSSRVKNLLRSKQTQHIEAAETAAMEVMRVGLLAEEAVVEAQEAMLVAEEAASIAQTQASVLSRTGSQCEQALLRGEQSREMAAQQVRSVEALGQQYATALEALWQEEAVALVEARSTAIDANILREAEEHARDCDDEHAAMQQQEQEARETAVAAEENARVSAVALQFSERRVLLAREQVAGVGVLSGECRQAAYGDAIAAEFKGVEEQRGPAATSYAMITTAQRDAVASCALADKLVIDAGSAVEGARGHFARLQESAEQVLASNKAEQAAALLYNCVDEVDGPEGEGGRVELLCVQAGAVLRDAEASLQRAVDATAAARRYYEEVLEVWEEAGQIRLALRAAHQHLRGEVEAVGDEVLLALAMQEGLLQHCSANLTQFESELALASEVAEQDQLLSSGLSDVTRQCEEARSLGRQAAVVKRQALLDEAAAKAALERALLEMEELQRRQDAEQAHLATKQEQADTTRRSAASYEERRLALQGEEQGACMAQQMHELKAAFYAALAQKKMQRARAAELVANFSASAMYWSALGAPVRQRRCWAVASDPLILQKQFEMQAARDGAASLLCNAWRNFSAARMLAERGGQLELLAFRDEVESEEARVGHNHLLTSAIGAGMRMRRAQRVLQDDMLMEKQPELQVAREGASTTIAASWRSRKGGRELQQLRADLETRKAAYRIVAVQAHLAGAALYLASYQAKQRMDAAFLVLSDPDILQKQQGMPIAREAASFLLAQAWRLNRHRRLRRERFELLAGRAKEIQDAETGALALREAWEQQGEAAFEEQRAAQAECFLQAQHRRAVTEGGVARVEAELSAAQELLQRLGEEDAQAREAADARTLQLQGEDAAAQARVEVLVAEHRSASRRAVGADEADEAAGVSEEQRMHAELELTRLLREIGDLEVRIARIPAEIEQTKTAAAEAQVQRDALT
ncbi:hypothetical protein B484DRAFT_402835, partial [Ochromonadaceae sp. CCMP2298]